MMIRTEDLIGDALDFAVASYLEVPLHDGLTEDDRYSTDWSIGGPLMEKEHICVNATGTSAEPWEAESAAGIVHSNFIKPACTTTGATILIAAMRCIVLVNVGEEVDIPEHVACL